ncbi:MAG: Flp family type IVb pilin [Myxococcota bacterium]
MSKLVTRVARMAGTALALNVGGCATSCDNVALILTEVADMLKMLNDFHRDEAGATATEYIILLILIACFVIAIVKVYGKTASSKVRAADEIVKKEVTF